MLQWCRAVEAAPPSALATTLLDRCRWLAGTPTLRPWNKDESEQILAARQVVFRLTRELSVFYYYAATMLQFFADLDEHRLRRALSAETGRGSLEQLASCRRAFALNTPAVDRDLALWRAAR